MQAKVMNVAGTLMFALNQWLQVILITRLLGLHEVGLFSYYLALTGPLVLFSRFMLAVLVPTQRKLAYGYGIFHEFRNITNYVFIAASILVMLAVDLSMYERLCLIIFVLYKFYENKEEFIYTENIAESNIGFMARSKIYKSVLTIVLFTAAALLAPSLAMVIGSLLISQMLIYYMYDRRHSMSLKRPGIDIRWREFRNIFILGIGLSIVEVLNSLVTNVPRYVLEHFHGVETLGIFATIIYFMIITNNVVVAINQSVVAGLSKEADAGAGVFYRSFLKLCGMFLILVIIGEVVLLTFGGTILTTVYGEQFAGYGREMLLLGILLIFTVYTKLFEMALSIFNIYNMQLVLQGITFTAAIALSFILIIPYGLTGAFLVAIFTYMILASGQIIVLAHHWKYKVHG
ncbi:lipopolysaccharide biosynthesis protein [Salinicoccus roseus]|uniref:lipopolysaccharide biosynthesis protein n=1 Tax=Salinicoccus roseus TaxID=45670 RepID=UPI002301B767|nr:oligosaccharide flippase family protein [Salinicoccus roseus]